MEPGDPAAVEQLFDSVAPSYDRLNDLLSLGLHRHWKRRLVSMLKPAPGEHWLDLCCGTGDLAFLLAPDTPTQLNLPWVKHTAMRTS